MEIINITCLRQKSQRHRPKWVGKLPERLAEKWQLKYCPWVETAEGCWCLQTDRDGCFLPPWREKARELLEQAAKQGAKIALSPMAADLPQDILPFATGRKLYAIFGAEGAATGLEAMGKRPEGASFVVADGGGWETEAVLAAFFRVLAGTVSGGKRAGGGSVQLRRIWGFSRGGCGAFLCQGQWRHGLCAGGRGCVSGFGGQWYRYGEYCSSPPGCAGGRRLFLRHPKRDGSRRPDRSPCIL